MRITRLVSVGLGALFVASCAELPEGEEGATPEAATGGATAEEGRATETGASAAPARRASPPASGPTSDTPIAEQMAGHFTRVLDARAAVVRGDLNGARLAGRALADEEPTAELPASWAPYVTAMRADARTLAGAGNLDVAGVAVGRLGAACGDCHAAVGATLTFANTPAPTGTDTASHMLQHQWGADRLWEGLIGPADDRWSGGAGALADAALHPSAIARGRTVVPEIAALAEHVHALGRSAQRASTPDARAQLYGELVVTCASCHEQLEEAPGH